MTNNSVNSGKTGVKIFLMRHGEDTDNKKNILNGRRNTRLTKKGRDQAKQAGQKLKTKKIDIIYSSPLKRVLETAQIVAKEIGINKTEIITNENLIERDFGMLTGKPKSDIPKYATKIFKSGKVNYFLETEGGETFPEVYRRTQNFLEKIKNKNNKKILIVTHGDTGEMLRAAYCGWPWKKGLKTPYFDNTEIIEL